MEAVLAYRFRVYPDAKRRREIDEKLVYYTAPSSERRGYG